jgi:hypothetical protein
LLHELEGSGPLPISRRPNASGNWTREGKLRRMARSFLSKRARVCGEDLSIASTDSKALNRLRSAQLRKIG